MAAAVLRVRTARNLHTPGRDVAADVAVTKYAAGIGHEDTQLTGNVGAQVSGMGQKRQQGLARHLIHQTTHLSAASARAAIRSRPLVRRLTMRPLIQSTCCLIATGLLHYRRVVRPGDREQVRKSVDLQAQVVAWTASHTSFSFWADSIISTIGPSGEPSRAHHAGRKAC